MQALALLLLLILIGAIVSGFVMYSKIPEDAPNNEQNLALAFASIGIMFPPLQVVPIVIGAKYVNDDGSSSNPVKDKIRQRLLDWYNSVTGN